MEKATPEKLWKRAVRDQLVEGREFATQLGDLLHKPFEDHGSVSAEIVGTFVLVYTVFSATDAKRSARDSHVPVLGFRWARILRRYLVEPAAMWWPQNLFQVSFFRSLPPLHRRAHVLFRNSTYALHSVVLEEPELNLVGYCNELNAGYTADGYARAKGVRRFHEQPTEAKVELYSSDSRKKPHGIKLYPNDPYTLYTTDVPTATIFVLSHIEKFLYSNNSGC